jgi:hypothetical protein
MAALPPDVLSFEPAPPRPARFKSSQAHYGDYPGAPSLGSPVSPGGGRSKKRSSLEVRARVLRTRANPVHPRLSPTHRAPAARVDRRSALLLPVMPRKSAAALSLVGPRSGELEPPPGLLPAERIAFVVAVRSVKPGHFALEDVPLLVAYASATVQERAISRELGEAETEMAKAGLRAAHGRVAGSLVRLARALRLGAMARAPAPSRHRRLQGTVEASAAPPWEYEPDGKPN